MKKRILIFTGLSILVGCSQVEQDFTDVNSLSDGDLVEKVIFEVLPIKDGDAPRTRASAVPNGGTVSFAWEENDMIGIYPNKGSQIYFTIEDGAGSSSATFDGGGWALKQNASYVSYYPFVADFFLSRDEIPVSFVGQKQVGTSSPFHGARYYLATESTSSENGVLRFSYKTLNTIINVNATLPAGKYTKMSLTIEDPLFVEEGTYSLDERTIVGTKFSNTLEIELEDVTLTDEATIPIYIMSAPVDLREKEVVVCFAAADGSSYKCIKTPTKEYKAGTRYGLTCNEMERENHPNNVIFYTSSDGNIVTPNAPYVFGANIVSNEYVEGRGVLIFDSFVAQIGNEAFRNCTNLVSISIHDGIDYIGHNAFEGCSNLTGISIPNGVQWIGTNAFAGCTSLTDVDISDSVTGIYSGIFEGCTSLTSIAIPDGVTSIEDRLFYNCESLTSITIPEGVTSIGSSAFAFCKSLTSIAIPDGVTSIGNRAYYSCRSLTSITIPEGVTSIGSSAFAYCTSLTSITIPDGVTSIEEGLFFNCSRLTGSITVPNGVTSIGNSAFYGCSSLTNITIPDSVKSIGKSAFLDCRSLISLVCLANTPPSSVTSSTFENTDYCSIYVPFGSVETYKLAHIWSDYADRILAIPSSVPVPEAVDLGLSVKWASFNLGASMPEEYGGHYAWGETWPKAYCWLHTYKWSNGDKLFKYCPTDMIDYWDGTGMPDGKTVLDPEDDAAHINLGSNWRIPTDAEWTELIENCIWSWTTQNGIEGRLITASNGNSIFLPAAGYRSGDAFWGVGTDGCFWSSSLSTEDSYSARYVGFLSDSVFGSYMGRYEGLTIRPVYAD